MLRSRQEKDNLTRWKPNKKNFYEVYYLKWTDPAQGVAAWLRYTLLAPANRDPEVSVWGIFFDVKDPRNNLAVKKNFPIQEARIDDEIFYFAAGPSAIFETGARGEISDGRHRMSWELKCGEGALPLRHFPRTLYYTAFPKTKLLAPALFVPISGEFLVDDRKIVLQNVPAHQGHLWGTEMAASWIWGNCNAFDQDSKFCFEGLSARTRLGRRLLPPITLLFFYWEGRLYRFNAPTEWFSNQSRNELDRWHFEAGSGDIRFVGDLVSNPSEMAGVRYEAPDGSERLCHHTETADLKIQILQKKGEGWESVKTLTASRTAAYEVVQPTHDPRVKRLLS